MKYVSLFAGIGGFDLALNRLGHECVYVNEWDKYAAQTYEKNFKKSRQSEQMGGGYDSTNASGNEPNEQRAEGHRRHPKIDTRDITTVPTTDIPDHDLLVGGFPCQAFSIAGKRRGFDDTRGTLFFDIARILKDKRPRHFILENVKGLLSHDEGKTFSTILGVLSDLGYEYQWQVLNSKNFGVPQNRERVFIVGHIRGERRPEIFPIREANSNTCEIVGKLTGLNGHDYLKRVYSSDAISPTLPTGTGGNHYGKFAVPVLTPDRANKRQNGRRFKEDGDPSFTLTAQDKHGVYDGMKIRRLTPTECERLQGFPDGWTEGVSDTQRYKQLGNAVTVNVVYEVAKRL